MSDKLAKDCPTMWELPKYITIMAHDGEGNPRNVRFINEEALRIFYARTNRALDELDSYSKMGESKGGE